MLEAERLQVSASLQLATVAPGPLSEWNIEAEVPQFEFDLLFVSFLFLLNWLITLRWIHVILSEAEVQAHLAELAGPASEVQD